MGGESGLPHKLPSSHSSICKDLTLLFHLRSILKSNQIAVPPSWFHLSRKQTKQSSRPWGPCRCLRADMAICQSCPLALVSHRREDETLQCPLQWELSVERTEVRRTPDPTLVRVSAATGTSRAKWKHPGNRLVNRAFFEVRQTSGFKTVVNVWRNRACFFFWKQPGLWTPQSHKYGGFT